MLLADHFTSDYWFKVMWIKKRLYILFILQSPSVQNAQFVGRFM